MKFRSLTPTGDWLFGQDLQSYSTQNQAIAFNIQTSLLSFLKDCWFAPTAGIDWLRLLGTPGTQNEIELTVKGVILQCYGVTAVNSVTANVNRRNLSVQYSINTIYTPNFKGIVNVI